MIDKKRQLASYVDAMRKASRIISEQNPDYLVAPMSGSIPFIDAMAIVDRDFDPTKVVYMPASSRIWDVSRVMSEWYSNFLDSIVKSPYEFPKILGIDEVVSGNSVVRCFKPIDAATNKKRRQLRQGLVERLHSRDYETAIEAVREADVLADNVKSVELGTIRDRIERRVYKNRPDLEKSDSDFFVNLLRDELENKLEYKTIGIEDSKISKKNDQYTELRERGRIIPIRVERIISMDDPDFSTAVFEQIDSPHKKSYAKLSPMVIGFEIKPDYLDFLATLANYVGVDSSRVSPVNMQAIIDSSRFLEPVK